MRRNATKVAAVVMSLAVTMTSVNLPTTAAAATKKVKLNKTKATLTVGKTTTLKVTKGGKAVKATFKSSNAKVAKVLTKSGKSTKIKALKKGTAKITATYAKKKYTCKITVKAKKVTTPTVAPTVEPTVEPTVAPTLVPTTEPSTDTALSTKKNAAKIEFNLTNAYDANHKNLVLVGTNANLEATVLDEDGKPVANAPVTLTGKFLDGVNGFGNLTLPTLTTNNEGKVTFVYGTANSSWDAMSSDKVASYKLTATVAGSNVSQNTVLKFGALTIESDEKANNKIVSVVNKYTDDAKRGDVKKDTDIPSKIAKVYSNTTENDDKGQEYVTKRQVSTTGVDNSVTFSSAAYLVIPGEENKTEASTITHTSGKSTGEYVTYKGASTSDVVKEVKASALKYATVKFDKISVSKHTNAVIKAYLIDNPEKAEKDWKDTGKDAELIDTLEIGKDDKDVNLENYSWQVNLDKASNGYLAIKVQINSAGQVNDDNNNGVSIKEIVGVYDKSTKDVNADKELAKDVKVSWDIAKNVSYTIPTTVTDPTLENKLDSELSNLDNNGNRKVNYTYKYSVPAFPHTGNAIITVYNEKNNVYTYISADTVTETDKNVNVIDTATPNLYQISEAETKDSPDATKTENESGTRVTVNANHTGITHLVGTISSTNKDIVLDASNDKVYTSVQWVPVNTVSDTTAVGYAFAGQSIKVIAQLQDKNGNNVKTKNEKITFNYNKNNELKSGELYNGGVKVLSISNNGVTDVNGQVVLEVSAEDVRELRDVVANTTSGYNVTFTLNGTDTKTKYLDLYWLDLDLAYKSCADLNTDPDKVSKETSGIIPTQTADVTPEVGSHWLYGVNVISGIEGKFTGKLAGCRVDSIEGVATKISMEDGYKGTYTTPYENTISNFSEANGDSNALFQIVPDSVKSTAKVTFKKINGNDVIADCYYAGVGQTNVDKRFKLNIKWNQGAIANGKFILPTGRYVADGETLDVYFQLTDKYGNAVKNDSVIMEVTDVTAPTVAEGTPVENNKLDGNKFEVKTTDKGRIKLTGITQPTDNTDNKIRNVVVTAKVDGTTYSQSYAWRTPSSTDGLKIESTSYNPTTKEIVLKFNEEVYADSSKVKDMFKKDAGDDKVDNAVSFKVNSTSDAKTFNAKDVKVSGKVVTITLPDTFNESVANESSFTIKFNPVTFDGVKYELVSAENGAKLNDAQKELTFTL